MSAWRDFAAANPPVADNVSEGADYLAVCDAATGPDAEEAAVTAAGLRAIRDGGQQELVLENDRKAMEAGGPRINEEWLTSASDGHRSRAGNEASHSRCERSRALDEASHSQCESSRSRAERFRGGNPLASLQP
jgi:hypothetical protein